jgi:FkbM family methyltransferase
MGCRKGTNDKDIICPIFNLDEYLTKTFSYQNGDIFIDLGAHIGSWSVLMGCMNPTFKVYSYEPIPENFDTLVANIRLNNLENVIPFERAVSSETEGEELLYYDDHPNSPETRYVASNYVRPLAEKILVKKISLNDIFSSNKIDKCRVLKTDCEGGELKAFKTISTENLQKIDYIIGECHPLAPDEWSSFAHLFSEYFIDLSDKFFVNHPNTYPHFLYKNKRA